MATRPRKVPLRTCIACRKLRPKRELLRVVRTPTGRVCVDATGKMAGRGANVCPTRACLAQALKGGVLARSLQVGLDRTEMERLRDEAAELLDPGDQES